MIASSGVVDWFFEPFGFNISSKRTSLAASCGAALATPFFGFIAAVLWATVLTVCPCTLALAQGQASQARPAWPNSNRLSGSAFLTPGLLKLQADEANSPIALWLDKGRAAWADNSQSASCQSCHNSPQSLHSSVPNYPRLVPRAGGQLALINLEDQILQCRTRNLKPPAGTVPREPPRLEDDDILSLSALLHDSARGQPINVQPTREQMETWSARLAAGAALFATRLGRINLACVHCHEQNIGQQMRIDVISPGHPTGFPVYRMSWQKIGSLDRRLRACYSGVQAVIPPPGAPELRDLELFLKVRANGMPLEGSSIRR
jgi:L-cysteine S-thiosulfotransferase